MNQRKSKVAVVSLVKKMRNKKDLFKWFSKNGCFVKIMKMKSYNNLRISHLVMNATVHGHAADLLRRGQIEKCVD